MSELIKNEKLMIEEIKLIQDIIKRMADNSFKIKGWTVTLVVVSLIFKNNSNLNHLIAFIPLLSFWILDAYYLKVERIYRKLYSWVIKNRRKNEDFLFDLNPKRFEKEVDGYIRTMFSISLGTFYGSILGLLLVLSFVDFFGGK